MRQIVYGDVLFLFNFSIDFLVLLLVGCFLSLRRRLLRLLPAALLGGAYAVLILLPELPASVALLINLLMAALMCLVAYAPVGGWAFVKLFVLFYTVSLLLGGAVQAFCNLLSDFFGTAGTGGVVSNSGKAEVFMLYAVISGVVIFVAGRILSRRSGLQSITVEIREGERTLTIDGLLDSGNFLKDPASGKPVILVRRKYVERLLPAGVAVALDYGRDPGDLPPAVKRKTRVILARGMGGSVMMVGYLPDSVMLYKKDKERTKQAVDAVLALHHEGERDFAGCAAIVPAVLWR